MIGGYNDIMITLSSTATLPCIQTIVVYTKNLIQYQCLYWILQNI